MMDDISPSDVNFKCIFEKFQVDEVSIDEKNVNKATTNDPPMFGL